MKVLILDGYNLIYRARHSIPRWQKENEYSIIYSFFRSLRPIVEKFDPDKVYFVTEGYPKMRLEASSEYKGTREREKDQNFRNQKSQIISMLSDFFPIEVVRHPDYECDDVIGFLAKDKHCEDDCVVVSTDTDFIQILNTTQNAQIYNPIKKSFVERPNFDYVQWKALRGDSCDNISGFRGIGDKRATALIESSEKLEEFLGAKPGRKEKFEHNVFMIRFHDMSSVEHEFEKSGSSSNWNALKDTFEKMEFKSIINDKSWDKFKNTFSKLEC
jgi:DNA polymerase I